jgi:hypothetical protein
MAKRVVRLGDATLTYPSPFLSPLQDSSDLLKNGELEALRERFHRDGYLYLSQVRMCS